jgi:hypothetical protein
MERSYSPSIRPPFSAQNALEESGDHTINANRILASLDAEIYNPRLPVTTGERQAVEHSTSTKIGRV